MAEKSLLEQSVVKKAANNVARILSELNRILVGRPELHELVIIGILSRGHILLEGLPGVGKTALIKTLGELFGLNFSRVQFTPDLMPGDILGSHILQQSEDGTRNMAFQPGPVFTNILLADEINRASPKTQSALLEAMQEKSVTIMGVTRKLPDPFFVLASQNPIELEGTYALPEAQLDRFLYKFDVKSATVETMKTIINSRRRGEPPKVSFTISTEELKELFEVMEGIYLPEAVADYIARLVCATSPLSEGVMKEVNEFVQYGASPRAAIAVAEASRASALISGRPTVGFEDVKKVFVSALNHRVILNYKAKFETLTSELLLKKILTSVKETKLDI